MFENNENRSSKYSLKSVHIKSIITGAVSAVIIALILFACIAWIMSGDNVPDMLITALTIAGESLSVFFGGFIAAVKNKVSGFYSGLFTGLLLFAILFIVSLIFRDTAASVFSLKLLFKMIFILVLSIIGGVVGVNIKRKKF